MKLNTKTLLLAAGAGMIGLHFYNQSKEKETPREVYKPQPQPAYQPPVANSYVPAPARPSTSEKITNTVSAGKKVLEVGKTLLSLFTKQPVSIPTYSNMALRGVDDWDIVRKLS